MKLSERVTTHERVGLRLAWKPIITREEIATEVRKLEAVAEASEELQEVADLRGDNQLPHPEDDPGLWTARMQTAWDELRDVLEANDGSRSL